MSRKQSLGKKVIPVDTSDDNEEIFEVESILDKRILAGQVNMRVYNFVRKKNTFSNSFNLAISLVSLATIFNQIQRL